MRLKFTFLFLFFTLITFSQNDSLLRKKHSFSYGKYNMYAFYDIVRFAGLGVEYKPIHYFGIDLKVGAIYPNSILASSISANDYFYMHGAGLMLTPKIYLFPKRKFYVGVSFAFYDYGYKNKWAQNGVDYAFNINGVQELRDRKTYSYAIGPTIGFTQSIGKINLELFIGLGSERTSNKIKVYNATGYTIPQPSLPYSYKKEYEQINTYGGIKIGFELKQQYLYTKRYYTKKLHNLIVDCDKIVLKQYASKNINRGKLQEYYDVRNEQYDALSRAYRKSPKDTAALYKLIKQGEKNITVYVNYVYGKH